MFIFIFRVENYCFLNVWSFISLKYRKRTSSLNLTQNWNFLDILKILLKFEWKSRKVKFHQISKGVSRMSFHDFFMVYGAKIIYFAWRIQTTTFGQHLGNKCCLNHGWKMDHETTFFIIFWHNKRFRQHLGNKCCLNVAQMLIFEFFMKNRCFLIFWSLG